MAINIYPTISPILKSVSLIDASSFISSTNISQTTVNTTGVAISPTISYANNDSVSGNESTVFTLSNILDPSSTNGLLMVFGQQEDFYICGDANGVAVVSGTNVSYWEGLTNTSGTANSGIYMWKKVSATLWQKVTANTDFKADVNTPLGLMVLITNAALKQIGTNFRINLIPRKFSHTLTAVTQQADGTYAVDSAGGAGTYELRYGQVKTLGNIISYTANTGYTYKGVSTASDGGVGTVTVQEDGWHHTANTPPVGTDSTHSGYPTLYCVFQRPTYTVTLVNKYQLVNGTWSNGTVGGNTVGGTFVNGYTFNQANANTGFHKGGLSTAATYANGFPTSITVNGNVSLNAYYLRNTNTYSVIACGNSNNGSGVTGWGNLSAYGNAVTYTAGAVRYEATSNIAVTATPATGYTYKGLYTSTNAATLAPSQYTGTTANGGYGATYYALFELNQYTITLNQGTGAFSSVGVRYNDTTNFTYAATSTYTGYYNAVAKFSWNGATTNYSTGYHWVGWYKGNTLITANKNGTRTITGNETLTASFAKNTRSMSVFAYYVYSGSLYSGSSAGRVGINNGAVTTFASTSGYTFAVGNGTSTATITASTTNTNYVFKGWYNSTSYNNNGARVNGNLSFTSTMAAVTTTATATNPSLYAIWELVDPSRNLNIIFRNVFVGNSTF